MTSFVSFTTRTIPPPPIPSPYFSTGLLFLKKEEETKGVASAKVKKGNDEEGEGADCFHLLIVGHFGMMETTLAQEQILYIFPGCSLLSVAGDVGGRIVLTSRKKVLVCMAPDQGAQGARQCLVCVCGVGRPVRGPGSL